MSKQKSKSSLLSEKLDFEAVNDAPDDAAGLDFLDMFDEQMASAAKTGVQSDGADEFPNIPPKATRFEPPVRSALANTNRTKNKKKHANDKKDNFARYAAIFALLGFLVLFAGVFYLKVIDRDESALSYMVLPRTVANIEGQVIRIQVTIQVAESDRAWLQENKKVLADLFQIEAAAINPDDLHSEQGFDKIRANLKDTFNKKLHTDKVDSVLINELLLQNRE